MDVWRRITEGNVSVTLAWFTDPVPAGVPILQVYGYLFAPDGRVLVQDDEGRFNLPGGKPEVGENFEETLRREAMEESQVTLTDAHYLGFVLVTGDNARSSVPYAQVRMVAKLADVLPPAPDASTGRCYRRALAPTSKLMELLKWEEAQAQFDAAKTMSALALGVATDGSSTVGYLP